MAPHREIRSRLERILSGENRTEDFTRLFLFLRSASYGSAVITEIGDFVAHADAKTKGIVTNEVNDFFLSIKLNFSDQKNWTLDLQNLPEFFSDAVTGNFRRIKSEIIRRDTGLKRKVANAILNEAVKKLSPAKNGGLRLTTTWTKDELAVIRCCSSCIVARPAFSDKDLTMDISSAILKNGLMHGNEKQAIKKACISITLYAISIMNGVALKLKSGTTSHLYGGLSEGKLVVNASTPLQIDTGRIVNISSTLFETSLSGDEYCHPSLVHQSGSCLWDTAVELTSSTPPRLVPL